MNAIQFQLAAHFMPLVHLLISKYIIHTLPPTGVSVHWTCERQSMLSLSTFTHSWTQPLSLIRSYFVAGYSKALVTLWFSWISGGLRGAAAAPRISALPRSKQRAEIKLSTRGQLFHSQAEKRSSREIIPQVIIALLPSLRADSRFRLRKILLKTVLSPPHVGDVKDVPFRW